MLQAVVRKWASPDASAPKAAHHDSSRPAEKSEATVEPLQPASTASNGSTLDPSAIRALRDLEQGQQRPELISRLIDEFLEHAPRQLPAIRSAAHARDFDTIDRMGGMVEAIERGFPQREVAESAYSFQQAVERREKIIVGVNDFVAADEEPIEILYIDESAGEQQLAKLAELKRTRDTGAVRRTLDALKAGAAGSANTMPLLIDAVRAYATVGEMCDALRDVWGEYEETPII